MAGNKGRPSNKKTETIDEVLEQEQDLEQIENLEDIRDNSDEKIINEISKQIVKTPKLDLTRTICIKNISNGKLVYKSKRQMGCTVVWENKNELNYMELGEFINLKNSDLRFITEPWIRVIEEDEVEILKYANIYQYYKEIIEIKDMDNIFKLDFDRFKSKFNSLPDGYKKNVAEYAGMLIRENKLDSIRIKSFIEDSMDIELDFLSKNKNSKNNNINIK